MVVDLQKFCVQSPGLRFALERPFWQNGKLIATDGRIMAWLDDAEESEDTKPRGRAPDVGHYTDQFEAVNAWGPLVIEAIPCEACGDQGWHYRKCMRCGKSHECERCDQCRVHILGQRFNRWLVQQMSELPGIEVAAGDRMLWFRFQGGGGCLMSCVIEMDRQQSAEVSDK